MKSTAKNTSLTLFCFSPPVMLFTFVSEFILAIYSIFKYRKTKFGRGVIITLFLLGFFQLSEFMVCRASNVVFWSRLGLVAITLLPAMGVYLVSLLDKKTWLLYLSYFLSIAFIGYIIFVPTAVDGAACNGNYVIFSGPEKLFRTYGYYYFGFLLLAMWESFQRLCEERRHQTIRKILFWFMVGYLSFLGPLTLVYIFIEQARNGIASIMCGFAIVFAFILALKINPLYHKLHTNKK